MRILSKKMKGKGKKGVSWNQGGRNRKLLGKAIADSLEIMEQMKRPIDFPTEELKKSKPIRNIPTPKEVASKKK